jgi:hypothetical protein
MNLAPGVDVVLLNRIFGDKKVSCGCGYLPWVVDSIPSDGETGSIWFRLFRLFGADKLTVCYVLQSALRYFVLVDTLDCVCSFDVIANTLC